MNAQLDIFAPPQPSGDSSRFHRHAARVSVQTASDRTIDVCLCGAAREVRGGDVGPWQGVAALTTNERLRLAGYHTTCPLAENERSKREVRDASGAVVFVGNAGAVTSWLEAQGR